MQEYLPKVPKHLISIAGGSEKKFILSILENKPLSQEEETLFRRVTDLCWKLNMAAQYTWVRDFDSAFKSIKMAKDELAFHQNSSDVDPSPSHVKAYEYAIVSSIATLSQEMMEQFGLSLNGTGLMDKSTLGKRWELLNSDNKSKAVFTFLKACLMSSLKIEDAVVLDKMKEV